MNNSETINQNWQQNERTASAERERSLCPPHEDRDEQEDDERDYAEEAFRIMAAKSGLLPEKAHLFALKLFYEEIIEEIKEMVGDAIDEWKK